MSVAELVRDPKLKTLWTTSGAPTNGHTQGVRLADGPLLPKKWTRVRITYEWHGLSLLLFADQYALTYAINKTKHDGTGTQAHNTINANAYNELFARCSGALQITIQRQHGQTSDSGWWSGHINGLVTMDGTATNPSIMGGDYWGIQGRFVNGAGNFKLGSYQAEVGKYSLAALYDWAQ